MVTPCGIIEIGDFDDKDSLNASTLFSQYKYKYSEL